MALQAQQIVALACQIAKVPGYTQQAGVLLNSILSTLCQTYDFDFICSTQIINTNPQANGYALNADHLRTREAFYNVNGAIFYMNQISIERYNTLFQGPGVDNYPESYAVDVSQSPMQMLFYPPPSVAVDVTVKYYPQVPDISTPETSTTVPWFTNTAYLIKELAADLLMITDDDRGSRLRAESAAILSKFLTMADDKEGFAQTIKLDRSTFRPNSSLSPTKAFPLG